MKLQLDSRKVNMAELNPGDVFFHKEELYRVSTVSEDHVHTGGSDDYFRRDKELEVYKIVEIRYEVANHYK